MLVKGYPSKAGAKVRLFFITAKLLKEKIHFFLKKVFVIDLCQFKYHIHIIIYYLKGEGGGKRIKGEERRGEERRGEEKKLKRKEIEKERNGKEERSGKERKGKRNGK